MIVDPSGQVLVSNLGWVDRGSLWVLDAEKMRPRSISLGEASHLRLHGGSCDRFVVEQHFKDARKMIITAQEFERPDVPLATVEVQGWAAKVDGDLAAFDGLPPSFVGYLGRDAAATPGYFLTSVTRKGVEVRRVDWFDQRFDHMYQSVMAVLERPGPEYLFSVQRSSNLVLCDARLGEVRQVPLADRHGNPRVVVHPSTGDLWFCDYDTLVRLDPVTLEVTFSTLLQPEVSGSRMFVGDPWPVPSENGVLVARPGQGDVVRVDPEATGIKGRWITGRQPLAPAMLDGRVLARDWKTGDLLLGQG